MHACCCPLHKRQCCHQNCGSVITFDLVPITLNKPKLAYFCDNQELSKQKGKYHISTSFDFPFKCVYIFFVLIYAGIWILNFWTHFHWTCSEVLSVETQRFIAVNLIISLSLADDPHTCFCRRLIQVAWAAMMDLVGIHGWSSLIIGML